MIGSEGARMRKICFLLSSCSTLSVPFPAKQRTCRQFLSGTHTQGAPPVAGAREIRSYRRGIW